jgi:hypothetical protein
MKLLLLVAAFDSKLVADLEWNTQSWRGGRGQRLTYPIVWAGTRMLTFILKTIF